MRRYVILFSGLQEPSAQSKIEGRIILNDQQNNSYPQKFKTAAQPDKVLRRYLSSNTLHLACHFTYHNRKRNEVF